MTVHNLLMCSVITLDSTSVITLLSEVCRPIYHWKALAPAVRTMYWSNTSDSVFLTEFASLLWITQGKHLKTRYTLYLKFDFIYSLLSLSNYLCCLTTTYKQVHHTLEI